MAYASHSSGNAHENGDCWPPACPICELDELMEDGDDE